MKRLYILVFFLLSLVIMWGLLKPGYIFTIDNVFGPYYPREIFQYHVLGMGPNLGSTGATHIATVFYASIIYLLDLIFPAWLIQKLLFVLLLTLSGVAMYRLVPSENTYGRYFAGLLYMINPFIYVRILSGSSGLLLSYAFLPLAVKSFIDLFHKPTFKNTVWVGIWLTLISPAEHFLPMALGIFFLFYIFKLFQGKGKIRLTAVFLGALAIFSVINASWIYFIISGEAAVVQSVSQMAAQDLEVYATAKGSNVFLNVATLYGFWRGGYYDPRFHFVGWQLVFSLILFSAVYGFVSEFNGRHGLYVKAMGIVAIVSLLLAIGVSSPYLSRAYYFLYENVPLFKGMRESQKFAALLVLAYAYLGGIGMAHLKAGMARLKSKLRKILLIVFAVLIFLIPLSYTYPMLFGLHGQIKNIDYPQDYYQVDALLNQDKDEFNILFLPWHNFIPLSWIGGNVGNPANVFFTKPVIQGDNIEIGEIYTQSTNPVSKYIESLLESRGKVNNFGEFVAPLDVKYIVLAKEVDYMNYYFLFEQADLTLLRDTSNLFVFENKSWRGFYNIGRQAQLLGWDETETEKLEDAILRYNAQRGSRSNLPGYIASGLVFIGLLGYLTRNWKRKPLAERQGSAKEGKD